LYAFRFVRIAHVCTRVVVGLDPGSAAFGVGSGAHLALDAAVKTGPVLRVLRGLHEYVHAVPHMYRELHNNASNPMLARVLRVAQARAQVLHGLQRVLEAVVETYEVLGAKHLEGLVCESAGVDGHIHNNNNFAGHYDESEAQCVGNDKSGGANRELQQRQQRQRRQRRQRRHTLVVRHQQRVMSMRRFFFELQRVVQWVLVFASSCDTQACWSALERTARDLKCVLLFNTKSWRAKELSGRSPIRQFMENLLKNVSDVTRVSA
jgi:hypothetical protein